MAVGAAFAQAPFAARRRGSRRASFIACAALAAATLLALAGQWRLRAEDATGLVGLRPRANASSAAGQEGVQDEMLPGVVGAVQQAFEALVEKQCDIVFDEVDHDSNGRLCSAELHVAILLAYGRLNQILGGVTLKAPSAREVKALLAAADKGGDGHLNRKEFKEVFVRRFMRRVAAQAAARLVTQKLLVPAGGVGLNLLANQLHIAKRLETALNSHSGWTGPKGMLVRSARRTITSTLLSQLGHALGPVVNMNIAAAIARGSRLEDLLEHVLRGKRAAAPAL